MAVPVEDDLGEGGGGGDTGGGAGGGGYTPTPSSDAALSLLVTATNITITAGQIADAGGPWQHYKVRVTSVNDAGASSPVEITV